MVYSGLEKQIGPDSGKSGPDNNSNDNEMRIYEEEKGCKDTIRGNTILNKNHETVSITQKEAITEEIWK